MTETLFVCSLPRVPGTAGHKVRRRPKTDIRNAIGKTGQQSHGGRNYLLLSSDFLFGSHSTKSQLEDVCSESEADATQSPTPQKLITLFALPPKGPKPPKDQGNPATRRIRAVRRMAIAVPCRYVRIDIGTDWSI